MSSKTAKSAKRNNAATVMPVPAAPSAPIIPGGEKMSVVNVGVSPGEAAAELDKTEIATLLKTLDGEAVDLGNAMSDFETMVDKRLKVIRDGPAEIERLLKEHTHASAFADHERMKTAGDALRGLREKVCDAEGELRRALAYLERLAAQRETLRVRTVDTQHPVRVWFEAAKLAVARLSGRLDLLDNLGGKVSALRRKLDPYIPVKEPTPPVAAAPPAPVTAAPKVKPKCPRCGRTKNVRETAGGYVCDVGWHGAIVFKKNGEVIKYGHSAFVAAEHGRGLRTSY